MAEMQPPQSPKKTGLADSAIVAISANLPMDRLRAGVSGILALADSAVLTVRGDAKRLSSVLSGLGERVILDSFRLTIRGDAPAGPGRGPSNK